MFAVRHIPTTVAGPSVRVVVEPSVHRMWRRFQQKRPTSTEACGILIGGYSMDLQTIYIEKSTAPGKRDTRTRHSFALRSPHHQRAADHACRLSEGKQFYLGTWHTHPCEHPTPSEKDWKDWNACRKRNLGFELFVFAIIGTESVLLSVHRGE